MKHTIFWAAALLFILTFSACQGTSENSAQSGSAASTSSLNYSADYFVHKDTANKMIQSYLSSIATQDAADSTDLQSLIMNAAALRSYLQDTSIKEVKVMFAHTQKYMNDGHQGQPAGYQSGALTIIFAGFDQAGNYVYAPGNLVPNRVRPCPNNCPISGSATSPLLQ